MGHTRNAWQRAEDGCDCHGYWTRYGSTGNLRTAADAFGVRESYENLSPVRNVLRSWAQDVYDETRRELTLLRTLPGQGDV